LQLSLQVASPETFRYTLVSVGKDSWNYFGRRETVYFWASSTVHTCRPV